MADSSKSKNSKNNDTDIMEEERDAFMTPPSIVNEAT